MGLQLSTTLWRQHYHWQPAWKKEDLPHDQSYYSKWHIQALQFLSPRPSQFLQPYCSTDPDTLPYFIWKDLKWSNPNTSVTILRTGLRSARRERSWARTTGKHSTQTESYNKDTLGCMLSTYTHKRCTLHVCICLYIHIHTQAGLYPGKMIPEHLRTQWWQAETSK